MQKQKDFKRLRQTVIYLAVVLFSILYIVCGKRLAVQWLSAFHCEGGAVPYKARVTKIISREDQTAAASGNGMVNILFEAELLNGVEKGRTVTVTQQLDPVYPVQMKEVENGDKVLIFEETEAELPGFVMGEYVRFDTLLVVGLLFGLGLLLFGRRKGVNTIVSLGFTCLSVFAVFVPAVLSGQNIYAWSIVTCIFITVMTLLIVSGASRKSLAAGIGCFCGVAAAGILAKLMDSVLHLTGMVDEDSMYLYLMNEKAPIDLKAIVFAGIVIGAIGAVMDVAMSLSSSLYELKERAPDIPAKALFRSGVNIGRDIMGTMANTLVLAYIGSALSVTLLLIAYSSSMEALLNREMIVVEILNALAGSTGILLTLPLTSAVCALLYAKRKTRGLPAEPTDGAAGASAKAARPPFFSLDVPEDDDYNGL